ncbi:hypothetical protein AGMMS49983_14800 [Clostridia bacterium]|nr:hypothetical protein AGMMS49983_14800 [Clostridia bacterium]
MLSFGVLGAGVMANTHIDGVLGNGADNVKYIGVYDEDLKKSGTLAEKFGMKTYCSFEEMLADDEIDGIDICLPSFLHEEFAIRAAQAKKHILVEKPIAFTPEAAERIFGVAHENGVRIMVAQVLRFWPEYATIKDYIDRGELGDIVTIYAARLGQMPSWGGWYKDPDKAGGALENLILHDIDFLHYLLGKPKSVYSVGAKDEYDIYNDVLSVFKFENGANVYVDGSLRMTVGYTFTMHMRVLGTKGTMEFLYKGGENVDTKNSLSELKIYHDGDGGKDVQYTSYDAYGKEVSYFAACIESGKETETVTEESVLTVLNSIVKANESLITGQVYAL